MPCRAEKMLSGSNAWWKVNVGSSTSVDAHWAFRTGIIERKGSVNMEMYENRLGG